MEDFYSTGEVLEILGIKKPTLYQWVSNGKLKAYHRGGGKASFFRKDEIAQLLTLVPKKISEPQPNPTNLTLTIDADLTLVEKNKALEVEKLLLQGGEDAVNELQTLFASIGQEPVELANLCKAIYRLGYERGKEKTI